MLRKFMLITLGVALSACVMTSPDHVANKFCALNGEPEQAKVKKILSQDLRALWDQAMVENDQWVAENPGEKPPLGDGVPTQAFPDFAPICKVRNIRITEETAEAEIFHGFDNNPSANWTDILVLKAEKGSWVIDDIRFAPNHEGNLREVLVAAAKDDIDRYLDRREACEHFIGEEPYDEERRAFLNQAVDESCTGINGELESLRIKYATKPNILKKLTAFEPISGF